MSYAHDGNGYYAAGHDIHAFRLYDVPSNPWLITIYACGQIIQVRALVDDFGNLFSNQRPSA